MTTLITTVPGLEPVPLELTDRGAGRPVLLLHGGAGPRSVTGFAEELAGRGGLRVLAPTHPGFDGTPRPGWLGGVPDLARLYGAVLDELDLADVTVVGNSVGGWIAAELGLLGSARLGRLVLVDAVGVQVPGEPVTDVFGMSPRQIAELSYADPDRFALDPSTLGDAQRAAMAANIATLGSYAGNMTDPGLLPRLAGLTAPTDVVWGAADRICTPAYGRALAAAIPGSRFTLLESCGHLPQLEAPEALVQVIDAAPAR